MAAASGPPSFVSNSAQFVYLRPLRRIESTPVVGFGGRYQDLSELVGHWTLINIWASWCAPCVAELPSLDRLQHRLSSEGLRIVAMSIDGLGSVEARDLVQRLGLRWMTVAFDGRAVGASQGALAVTAGGLPLYALPISYLLDPFGQAVGYFPGAAEWDSPSAVTFLRHFLRKDR